MKLFHDANIALSLLLGVALLGGPGTASAQGSGTRDGERTYGTKDETSHTLSAWAFVGLDAANASRFENFNGSRYCTATCTSRAPVLLPDGAVVTRLELEACDTASSRAVVANLRERGGPNAAEVSFAAVGTGFLEMPGCGFFGLDVSVPLLIDNVKNTYHVEVVISGNDETTRFSGVRVFYRLQVSSAPAEATFSDVPKNHPFFRFIEALVAAGITTGCSDSPPLFCPDDVVTRKQMAKFLSTALGLHFAP